MGGVIDNIRQYVSSFMVIQYISIIQGLTIFLLMIVLYPILWNTNKYDSGLDTPYAWVTTSVYLSGPHVVGVLTAILILFLIVTYFLAMGSHYYPQYLARDTDRAEQTCSSKSTVDEKDGDVDLTTRVKSFLRLFFILVINVLIVGAINFRYAEIIDNGNVQLQQLASFGVAVFKVFWSFYGLKYVLIRNRWLHCALDKDDVNVAILTVFRSVPSFLTFLSMHRIRGAMILLSHIAIWKMTTIRWEDIVWLQVRKIYQKLSQSHLFINTNARHLLFKHIRMYTCLNIVVKLRGVLPFRCT